MQQVIQKPTPECMTPTPSPLQRQSPVHLMFRAHLRGEEGLQATRWLTHVEIRIRGREVLEKGQPK
jgi:hypothetical protein